MVYHGETTLPLKQQCVSSGRRLYKIIDDDRFLLQIEVLDYCLITRRQACQYERQIGTPAGNAILLLKNQRDQSDHVFLIHYMRDLPGKST
jgi:hypothetical protein